MSQEHDCGVCSDTGKTSDGRICGHCPQGTIATLESELEGIQAMYEKEHQAHLDTEHKRGVLQGQNELLKRQKDELDAKLSVNKCNSGHVTHPISLWDCPVCTELIRKENLELKREICTLMANDSAAMSNVQNPGKTKEECAIDRKWPYIFEQQTRKEQK